MTFSTNDLQLVQGQFKAECEADGIRVSSCKSEAMVLNWNEVQSCPLVKGESLSQVQKFKYFKAMFTSDGKVKKSRMDGQKVCLL